MIATRRVWTVNKSVLLLWGGSLAASVLVSLFTSARLPSVADAAIRTPLTLLVGALLITAVFSAAFHASPKDTWQRITRAIPTALLAGVALSITGAWNDGSGVAALPLRDAATFLASGGLAPRAIGPDALLRFTFLALAVFLGWTHKAAPSVIRRATVGIAAWMTSAVVLLIPSWMASVSSLLRGTPLAHAQDAVRALGAMHTSSYWSSFQADRFFTGIGDEVANAAGLSASAMLLLVALACGAFLARKSFSLQRLVSPEAWFLCSGAALGFLVGIRGHRFSWGGVNALAVALLVVVAAALSAVWIAGKRLEHYDAALILALLAGGILGWPALVLVLAFLFLSWLLHLNEFSRVQTPAARAVAMGSAVVLMTALGGVVGARSPIFPHALAGWIAAWAVFAAAAIALRSLDAEARKDPKRVFGLASLSAVGFVPRLPIPAFLGVFALYLLAIYLLRSRGSAWGRGAIGAALGFAWIASVLGVLSF